MKGQILTKKIVLKNGITICNFSSPHYFKFITGEELPGTPKAMTERLMLNAVETEKPNSNGWTDIEVRFEMTEPVRKELERLNDDSDIDVVLVPLPVMTAIKESRMPVGKARVCRLADRVNKLIYSDKFCV